MKLWTSIENGWVCWTATSDAYNLAHKIFEYLETLASMEV